MNKPKLYLINGPLGAGKTTFLKEMLNLPGFKDARVIENEFASTSIDTQQLHNHQAEVQTIAGVCICCSTGDELTDALESLSHSLEPVIIEATGVANSLKLIEKIVVADMLEKYDIAHAIFVLDGAEAVHDIEQSIALYKNELEAADTVLISKTDLISSEQTSQLMDALQQINISHASFVYDGSFDKNLLRTESHILDYFALLDEDIVNHEDDSNYTIVDLQDVQFDLDYMEDIWKELRLRFGLRRLKGDAYDLKGEIWHLEATPAQCRASPSSSAIARIVLIGSDARSITKSIIQSLQGAYYMDNNKQSVQKLLVLYEQYKKVSIEENQLSRQLSKAKLLHNTNPKLVMDYKLAKEKLQSISDSMTFENPIVWMMYKFEAYKNEAQPIQTMQNFRIHCSKDGYVCTKRFTFLNDELKGHDLTVLTDHEAYQDTDSLARAFESPDISRLLANELFMATWNKHEFYQENRQPRKWENY